MIIVISKILVPKGYTAVALFPFIIVRDKGFAGNAVLINHERIHLAQQAELLVLPFYLLYIGEYILRLIQYKNAGLAYRNISFEREAYANETDFIYLKNRRLWSFKNYL